MEFGRLPKKFVTTMEGNEIEVGLKGRESAADEATFSLEIDLAEG